MVPYFLGEQEEGEVEAAVLTRLCVLERSFYIERLWEGLVGVGHT